MMVSPEWKFAAIIALVVGLLTPAHQAAAGFPFRKRCRDRQDHCAPDEMTGQAGPAERPWRPGFLAELYSLNRPYAPHSSPRDYAFDELSPPVRFHCPLLHRPAGPPPATHAYGSFEQRNCTENH